MNTSVQTIPFNFNSNDVRVVNQDGNAWFVAQDISDALGYRDARDMVRVLDDDEKGTHTVRTLGGNQEMLTVSESGLYHALFKSRKKEAVVFRKWVTSEVLPSIRKTGTYTVPQLATPEQKQHIKSLVNKRVVTTGLHHQKVWTAIQEIGGYNKLDNLTPQAYSKICNHFKVEPIGINPEDWQAAPKPIAAPAPQLSDMEIFNLRGLLSMIEPIKEQSEVLQPMYKAIDSQPLRRLWSLIDHAAFMSSECVASINKLALH